MISSCCQTVALNLKHPGPYREGFTQESSISKPCKKENNFFLFLWYVINITWHHLLQFVSFLLKIHHLSLFILLCSCPLNNLHPTLFSFGCVSSPGQSLSDITHLHLLGNTSLTFFFKDSSLNFPIFSICQYPYLSISTATNVFFSFVLQVRNCFSVPVNLMESPFPLLHNDE